MFKLMVDGASGLNGSRVLLAVVVLNKEEPDHVTALLHNLEVTSVQLMAHQDRKVEDAMKILVLVCVAIAYTSLFMKSYIASYVTVNNFSIIILLVKVIFWRNNVKLVLQF